MERNPVVRLVEVPFLLAWPPRRYAAQVLLPRVVFVRRGVRLSRRLLAHELQHVDQIERYGLLRYWARYVRLLVRYGYAAHPMEVEARAAESDAVQLARAARRLAEGEDAHA